MQWCVWIREAHAALELLTETRRKTRVPVNVSCEGVTEPSSPPLSEISSIQPVVESFRTRLRQVKEVMRYLRSGNAVTSKQDLVTWVENEFIEVRAVLLDSKERIIESLSRNPMPEFSTREDRNESSNLTERKRSVIEWRRERTAATLAAEEEERRLETERLKDDKILRRQNSQRRALIRSFKQEREDELRRQQEKGQCVSRRERANRMRQFSRIEDRINKRNQEFLSRKSSCGTTKRILNETREEIAFERSKSDIDRTKALLRRIRCLTVTE